jgi:hypothetical protein
MKLDIPTMMVCDAVIVIFIGLLLLFYRHNQKTYPGFGIWITGTFITAIGYAGLLLRGPAPAWPGVFCINISFILGSVLRLDGVRRFMRNAPLPVAYYIVPVFILLVTTTCFYFFYESILLRNLVLSIGIFFFASFIGKELIRHAPQDQRSVYVAAGIINIVFGLEIITCAGYLLYTAVHNTAGVAQFLAFHQLFIILYETGWCLLFMMLNSRRIESELYDYQGKLQDSVDQLQKAMSEIKTLSGLLPICSICKMVRDDKGYWRRIEAYISSHSDAEFSHSICPDCAKEQYPELDLYEDLE